MPPPFAAVWFDCDSTLSAIEGVDELLQFVAPAQRAELAALTTQAMDGTLPLATVYVMRLASIAPKRDQVAAIGELYVHRLVPHARDVVQALLHLGKQVGICSGGLLPAVQHVAAHLGVPPANVHAVPVTFDAGGRYVDFDRSSPLWKNHGKVEVLRTLPASHRPLAFVGDGATDLETQGTVDLFVGFGGVVTRPVVRQRAAAFIGAPTLAPLLQHVLTADERRQLARLGCFQSLLSAADG